MPDVFFEWLQMPRPPLEGTYFLSLGKYLHEMGVPLQQQRMIQEQLEEAISHPWEPKKYPYLTSWLDTNDYPLHLIVKAAHRPDYYHPMVAPRHAGDPPLLLGAPLPAVQKCRKLAYALLARAMLRLGMGQEKEAWNDLLACDRLGRLLNRGGTFIEELVGLAIHHMALNAELVYLQKAKLTAVQLRQRLRDWQRLPPLVLPAEQFEGPERLIVLDYVQHFLYRDIDLGLDAEARQQHRWRADVLRRINYWYDRLATAARLPDPRQRRKTLEKVVQEIEHAGGKPAQNFFFAVKFQQACRAALFDKKQQKTLADRLVADMALPILKLQNAHDRLEQAERNLLIAFALAIYHREHGRYPARLEELTPKYLPAVPRDLFSGRSLIYRPEQNGYLLYSVGCNGQDDGGRSYEDTPVGDDIRIRLPLTRK
jgi:hypothetical protein